MSQRIDNLIQSVGNDKAILISGYPNIFYYSGFTSEDAYLIISPERRMIVTDSRYYIQAKMEAPDFDIVKIEDGWEKIWSKVHEATVAFEEDSITYGTFKKIREKSSGKTFLKFQKEINAPRSIKEPCEIELIKEAESIGDRAFSYILDFVRVGISERDVALEIEMYMKKNGATSLSFATIVASGVRSSMPHGIASDKIIEYGDLLTLDFGCIYKGYCSDMTRTIAVGKASDRAKEIYNIVLDAQTTAISGMYEGIPCAEADKIARDIIKNAGYGDNFGHSLGHSVGVEIHENPVFSPKSKDILQNGNVLSVEPGIYVEGFGGVRIEDLIAVRDGKIVNLTESPKNLIII